MKKVHLTYLILILCCLIVSSQAAGVDLVFLGILGDDAPSIEKTFDSRLRDALSVNPEYHLADYLASQDLRRRISFDDFPTVSRKLVESLRQYSSDSTIFIWASVKSHGIAPVRKWLIKASALGELTLTLNMYSLRYREYGFIGTVHCSVEKDQGFLFFYPLEKGVHVSAADRMDIMEKLVDTSAYKSAGLVSSVVKSEKVRSTQPSDTAGMQQYKAASLSEMFRLPSVEAANIDRNKKKPSSGTPVNTPPQKAGAPTDSAKAKK